MELQELYNLIESHLDNEISSPQEKMGKFKRIRLPIPEEYGGGIATGWGYEDAVRNLISRVSNQIKMESKSPTFRESWETWIRIKEGQSRSPSTISNYKYIAKVHLLPFFGTKPIDQITPDDVQLYFNKTMNLSKSISNQSRAILKGIFDRAVKMKDIPQNIMLYQYERSKKTKEKVVLQDEDLLRVINDVEELKNSGNLRDYLYSCFLCFTALRRGEILGLRWEDIDFDSNEINVKNNVTFPNGANNPVIRQPKDGSFGVVYLQSELLKRIRPYAKSSGYVLPYSLKAPNKPMTKSMFVKMWSRISKTVDLNGATSHSFRASYATMMNTHCDHIDLKALQGALRHKTPDLAIKVYTKENLSKTKIAEKEYDEWLSNKLAD